MKREQIELREIIKHHGDITEDWCEEVDDLPFEYIQEEQVCFDTEKGYINLELIFKRKSDDKYFKVKYSNWGQGETDMFEKIAKEIFPKQITTTIYE